ncbi:MAG TPA: hypothetical protein EYG76_02945 [Methanothermococcus okinawensis]|uniref:Probable [NiFe]-hydrogenase-type-3 Eha complex membrane subunit A n=1 Tax=Methanothermococcus okinawensis TaxID=155863 RepID=A0A832YWX1_9EURY|nr:hypothetical protein [Methanothermococcus okinawensis]
MVIFMMDVYCYIISVIISVIIGLIIKLPLKLDKKSFEGNLFFPTIFIALGLTSIVEFLFGLNIIFSLFIGLISPIFSKYVNIIFPGVKYGSH